MRVIDASVVANAAIRALGLDSEAYGAESTEVLACAVRRLAAMSCPCPRRTLVRAVAGAFTGLTTKNDHLADTVDEVVDALISHGDLLELRDSENEFVRSNWRVHAAPPAFVRRASGSVLLLGVAPDEVFPLPPGLQSRVRHRDVVRALDEEEEEDLPAYLSEIGLLELTHRTWLRAPSTSTSIDHLRSVNALLDSAPKSASIKDLRILDSAKSVLFYNGRWTMPKRESGRYIARRPQQYGAPLWCYVELENGHPGRLLDLPRDEGVARGCDEAWRVQAAIDACRGTPQRFRRRSDGHAVVLDFYAPLPRWAARRLTRLGEPEAPLRCLFSRKFSAVELPEELRYLREELWLEELTEG